MTACIGALIARSAARAIGTRPAHETPAINVSSHVAEYGAAFVDLNLQKIDAMPRVRMSLAMNLDPRETNAGRQQGAASGGDKLQAHEIGRASCRERVKR